MNQTQALNAGKYAKNKICEVLEDIKSLLVNDNNQDPHFIINTIHDSITKRKIYSVNFANLNQVENVFVQNTYARGNDGHIVETPETFSYISIGKILRDVLSNKVLAKLMENLPMPSDSNYSEWTGGIMLYLDAI